MRGAHRLEKDTREGSDSVSADSLFIELDVFVKTLELVNTSQGGADYQDVRALYGDMSRAVVAWLAKASSEDIAQTYERGGWRGTPDIHGLQQAARMWYAANCPERVLRMDTDEA